MKILVLNGSPRGEKSNTYKIANAFTEGISTVRKEAEIEHIDISRLQIEHCKGCFLCWTATPGKCVIRDDMTLVLEKMKSADVVIWSMPLYYFGMPSKMKALTDRQLPNNLPYIEISNSKGNRHPERYENSSTSHVLISSCGFSSVHNNYEALIKQFDIMLNGEYEKIICPEGELIARQEVAARISEYLNLVKKAGEEYAAKGKISDNMSKALDEPIYPEEVYIKMANASWEIAESKEGDKPIKTSEAQRFTKQMAALYNKASYTGKDQVVIMNYTDIGETYKLTLGSDECTVEKSQEDLTYTVRIETPLTVWQDIAKGVYSGQQALFEGKYHVLGDLKFMIAWDKYFSIGSASGNGDNTANSVNTEKKEKPTNMNIMIIPWMAIWIFLSINTVAGAVAGTACCALIYFVTEKYSLTIYDKITGAAVLCFSLLALLSIDLRIVIPLSYLCFGIMWTVSCFTKIPLSANYSKNEYHGDMAFKNPIFMKTNRILSVCWGVLYLITPIWTYYFLGTSIGSYVGLINSICPIVLGVFTAFFQKWYPSKVAAGR